MSAGTYGGEPYIRYICDGCEESCDTRRFHCQECKDFDYCPACYEAKGRECHRRHKWFSEETLNQTDVKDRILTQHHLGVGVMTFRATRLWASRPCIGYAEDPKTPPPRAYKFLTYEEVRTRALSLLLGVHLRLLDSFDCAMPDREDARIANHVEPLDHLPMRAAIFMKNCPEWVWRTWRTPSVGSRRCPSIHTR